MPVRAAAAAFSGSAGYQRQAGSSTATAPANSGQNGVLWQHFRKEAAKLNPADDAALTDVLLRWLFTRLSAADHT
ncbi:hypothetical protein P4W15_20045 [Morganella morganii]|nr:hypothetical protein [Morganella morganii]UXJ04043.1 hypothetical protein N6Y36_02520 [Morganella morganii]